MLVIVKAHRIQDIEEIEIHFRIRIFPRGFTLCPGDQLLGDWVSTGSDALAVLCS